MTVRPILTAPDPRLQAVSTDVETVDAEIRKLVDDMAESMYAADGIGLAAIQIGVAKRVLVIDLDQKEGKKNPVAYINPKIIWASDEMAVFEEGCLSVPEIWDDVERPARIKCEYLDRDGKKQMLEADGMLATCLQHEMDHLNGVLFIDHLSRLKRSMAIKKLTKAKKLKETPDRMALRLAFMGTPDFAVPTLAELIAQGHDIAAVYSQPPRPKGRGMALEPGPVHKFARKRRPGGAHAAVAERRRRTGGLRRAESGCRHCGGLWPAAAQSRFWMRPSWAVSTCMARCCRAGAAPPPSSAR